MGGENRAHARKHDNNSSRTIPAAQPRRLAVIRPPVGLALIDQEQAPRLAAYKQARPGVIIGEYGNAWQARYVTGAEEVTVTRVLLKDLLDELEDRGGEPDTG